ncbi:hypothetical protein PROFUN_06917 [Planoprotostelium fungivorum]|uniref:C2 domain-containing protein n=1 Tax=Planoprotostelium fungivorum TaxID=1890364 RepID=A0A2P6NMW9_9EUKA|nr:hypothetical protein PROFUN_06917 [Planoprotostelium fungivorum]
MVNFSIKIHEAMGLKAADLHTGKSDPFVEVRMKDSSTFHRTRVIDACLNPVWNETFTLKSDHPNKDILTFKVYDHNNVASNELLAQVHFPVSSILNQPFDGWTKMVKKSGKTAKGELKLTITNTDTIIATTTTAPAVGHVTGTYSPPAHTSPPQGYPSQPYPPPPQGYPSQAYPSAPQDYFSQRSVPQGYPSQPPTSQGYPPHASGPPQAYPSEAYPQSQGYPPAQYHYPPQGQPYPPQGYAAPPIYPPAPQQGYAPPPQAYPSYDSHDTKKEHKDKKEKKAKKEKSGGGWKIAGKIAGGIVKHNRHPSHELRLVRLTQNRISEGDLCIGGRMLRQKRLNQNYARGSRFCHFSDQTNKPKDRRHNLTSNRHTKATVSDALSVCYHGHHRSNGTSHSSVVRRVWRVAGRSIGQKWNCPINRQHLSATLTPEFRFGSDKRGNRYRLWRCDTRTEAIKTLQPAILQRAKRERDNMEWTTELQITTNFTKDGKEGMLLPDLYQRFRDAKSAGNIGVVHEMLRHTEWLEDSQIETLYYLSMDEEDAMSLTIMDAILNDERLKKDDFFTQHRF